MKKVSIVVRGMHERSDEDIIKDVLEKIEGVEKVVTDHPAKRVSLVAPDDVDISAIKRAIAGQGYDVGEVTVE